MIRIVPVIAILLLFGPVLACAHKGASAKNSTAQATENEQLSLNQALIQVAQVRDARGPVSALRSAVHAADPRLRRSAVLALGEIGGGDAVKLLLAALADSDPTVVRAAAFAVASHWAWILGPLERASTEVSLELALLGSLAEGFMDPEGAETLAMVRALGEFGGEEGESFLWESLRGQPELAKASAFALAQRARRGVVRADLAVLASELKSLFEEGGPALKPSLSYLSWRLCKSVRGAATTSPESDGEEKNGVLAISLMGPLERALEDSVSSSDLRAWSLGAIGCLGHSLDSRTPLVDRLSLLASGESRRDAIWALRALSNLNSPPASVLEQALHSVDPQRVLEAAFALARSGAWAVLFAWEPESLRLAGTRVSALASSLPVFLAADPASNVRTSVLEDATQAATLAEESSDARLRSAAYKLLAALPVSAGLPRLLRAADDEEDSSALIALASAVVQADDGRAEGQLLDWLQAESPALCAIASAALSEREGGHITEALLGAYSGERAGADWERRHSLVEALSGRDGVPPAFFDQVLRDREALVRLAGHAALVKRLGRAESGRVPRQRPARPLSDPLYGCGDCREAELRVEGETLRILLFPELAPQAVANFVRLAEEDYFDGLVFHRVVPDFVVQTGDPSGTGWGGPGWTLRDELSSLPYRRGTLGMARSGIDTAGSQWFIALSSQPHLGGHYTVFGQVQAGDLVALDRIQKDSLIEHLRVFRAGSPRD